MKGKRIMSKDSDIYHQPKCRYLPMIKRINKRIITSQEARDSGFRPCRYCNTMDHHYRTEKHQIDLFREKKGMEFLFDDRHVLYVKTDIGCWKMIYLIGYECIGLFHRNRSRFPVDFTQPWRTQYHKQEDRFMYNTIKDALDYIYEHDKFKADVRAKDITALSGNKKYKNSVKRAIRKIEEKRIDHLFNIIENQSTDVEAMRQYSFN